MKKYVISGLYLVMASTIVTAQTADEQLLATQMSFQQIQREQYEADNRVNQAQILVQHAKQRLAQAQVELEHAQAELTAAQAAQTTAAQAVRSTTEALKHAWERKEGGK